MTHTAAAATTGSTLHNTYQTAQASSPQELTTAINTITANQQSLYQHIALLLQQMAALSFTQQIAQARLPVFQAPPIQRLAISGPTAYRGNQGGYQQGFQQGCGGGRSTGGCCNNGCNNNRHRRGRTPFAVITWPPKAVVTLAPPVPSPLQVASPRNLSSPIWLSSITIGMFVILVVLMWKLTTT